MSDTVIKIENLSKQYRLGVVGTGTLTHDLNRWWARLRGKEDPTLAVTESNDRAHSGHSDFVWALNDVNLEVKQGDVLGIIGRNGAGKSTLLKILSRVTAPTTGCVKVKGRIASLLEVGTGFHPELTGRENIYLNGAILGMSRQEVTRKLDEIVDFSGCERFIDTPVKRYSSGMMVRLGFAVAAHLEPEILVVDEVLAVGDLEFQEKCIGKMQDVAGHGRTVLFVSHNMGSVRLLTQKAIMLEQGNVALQGKTEDVVTRYLSHSSKAMSNDTLDINSYRPRPKDGKEAKLTEIRCRESEVSPGDALVVEIKISSVREFRNASVCVVLKSDKGESVFTILSADSGWRFDIKKGVTKLSCALKGLVLMPGEYSIDVGINEQVGRQALDSIQDLPAFRVSNTGPYQLNHRPDRPGVVLPSSSRWDVLD